MLFEIAVSVGEVERLNIDVATEIFEEIARASRNGNHIFIIGRELCDYILRNLNLSVSAQRETSRIRETYTQVMGLKRRAAFLVTVISNGNRVSISEEQIIMPIGQVVKSEILNKIRFVVENSQNDRAIIFEAIRYVARRAGLENVQCSWYQGGGGALLHALDAAVLDGGFHAVVIDSDRKFPNDNESQFVRDVRRHIRKMQSNAIPVVLDVLPCHEIENIVPFEVIDECVKGDQFDHIKRVVRKNIEIELAQSVPADQMLCWFVDYKNGITLSGNGVVSWVKVKATPFSDGKSYIGGFGNNGITSQVVAGGKICGLMQREFSKPHWQTMYCDMISRLAWRAAGRIGPRSALVT